MFKFSLKCKPQSADARTDRLLLTLLDDLVRLFYPVQRNLSRKNTSGHQRAALTFRSSRPNLRAELYGPLEDYPEFPGPAVGREKLEMEIMEKIRAWLWSQICDVKNTV